MATTQAVDFVVVNVVLITSQCCSVSFQSRGPRAEAWRDAARRVIERAWRDSIVSVYMKQDGETIESNHTVVGTEERTRCESGWTGDRCSRPLGHAGRHSNE